MIPVEAAGFLQNYFDKIFVITLERAAERQQQVAKQLEGLSFEFFYGVDKNNLDWNSLISQNVYDDEKARRLNRYGKGMIIGHVACSLSHRKLYEQILNKGYKRVLIFEDDVVPFAGELSKLSATIRELPPDWETVYFGYAKYEKPTAMLKIKQRYYGLLSYLRLLKWSPQMVSNLLPKPYSSHLYKAGFHDLLHAYAVSASACKKLIAAQTPVVFNSDPLISYLIMNGSLNAFISRTKFFTQEMFVNSEKGSLING